MKTDGISRKKNNSDKTGGKSPRRKRVEESPKYSEESLYAIFEQSPLSIQVFSSKGDSVRANRAWEELWGSRREQLEGYNVLKDPQVKARGLLHYFQEALAGEMVSVPPVYYDPTEIGQKGRARWTKALIYPVKDSSGRVREVVLIHEDITERKQAEINIRQYADIVQNMQIGLYVFHLEDREDDHSLRLVSANPAALQFSGVRMEEVVGKTLDEGFPDLREQGIPQKYAEVIRSQEAVEIEVAYYDDSQRLDTAYAVKAFPLPTDHLGVVFESITERRQAEEKLRENETRLRNIIDNEPECIKILDSDGLVLQMNPAGLAMIEADTIQTVLGKSVYPIVTPEYRQSFQDLTERVFKGESGKLEFEIVGLQGTRRWLNTHAVPLRNEQGDVTGLLGITRDVTERRRAEDALRDSEKRFRALIENSSDEVSLLAADGSLLYESPSTNPTLGYTQGEFLGQNMFQLVHPEDLARVQNLFKSLMQSPGSRLRDRFRLRHKSGAWRWVEAVGANLLTEPAVQAVVVNYHDITERKQAEIELQTSEERFRQLAGNIQEVFWITDPIAQKDLYISPAYQEVWGRSPEDQMQNQDLFIESVLPEDREMVLATIAKQMQGMRTEMEYRITRPDGLIRWIWDRAFPILDESQNVKLVTGIAADITERKQAEAETLRYLAELQALYENGLAVSRLLSPREIGERVIQTFTHYLSWHHVTIRLRKDGSDELELVAFSVPHMEESEKEEVERNFNARISKVGQGMSGWVVQTGTLVRTGNVHTYSQYVNTYDAIQSGMYMPLKIGERVIGCISVESEKTDAFTAQDERLFATIANQAAVAFENARLYQATQQELFDRKHAEVMLERERNSLAQRVEERTTDLKRAIESLARALRVKDEFLANMSHELRTPLNAILGLSESLAEQVAGPLNEKQLKYVTTLSESGHHLLALINDILDLAKIEAGQITLDITRVDMESVCEASLRMVRQLAQKKNQEIELEIDRNFGLIWADERRLKQMIVNLLSNAVKFTPENRKIGLEVHGDKGENRVLITVWDNGIGIEENDLSQLFQPFVQLDSGLARETSGTGLGLALVAQMARLHGGGVSVASLPGQGSRFTIVIPWEPALRPDTIERLKITGKFRAVKPDGGDQQTILLIEDTKEVIMLITDYLELTGYKVVTAEDGIEGITQARLTKPDLILMDLQMPRMDGIEATQKLRSEPDFKYTPIIALTALAMPNDRERCLAAGMDEYISKPVNLKALVKIIQGFLANDAESKSEGIT